MEWRFSLDETAKIATLFWKTVGDHRIIAFHGNMGAGKTTFIHALCDVKKVSDTVGSPTFSIINEYAYPAGDHEGKIYHIDLYRLKDEEEAIQAGVEDCFYSDHICLVEWPEKAPGIFPPDTMHVYLEVIADNRRKLVTGS